jgi:H+/gluconate symporter-like permease
VVGPEYNFWLSSKLHAATGVWNLEELIGHIGYMVGMFSVLYLVADRLDMTRAQFYSFVRYRIALPACLVIAIMVAIFVPGPGKHYVADTITAPETTWLRAYWLTLIVFSVYIGVQASQGLFILRRDPRSRRAANAYLCALGVSAVGALSFLLEIHQVSWVLIRVEVVAYAIAASYTWHAKRGADVPSELLPG